VRTRPRIIVDRSDTDFSASVLGVFILAKHPDIITSGRHFDAIVANNDEMAIGAIDAALRYPRQGDTPGHHQG
jgi:DNA-binding LacI/PurR family transcriptional regulator